MKRQCSDCGKSLGYECDHCHSLNVRQSRTDVSKVNCGSCYHSFPETSTVEKVVCISCQTKRLKESRIMREFSGSGSLRQ